MHYNRLPLPFKWVISLFSKYESLNLGIKYIEDQGKEPPDGDFKIDEGL